MQVLQTSTCLKISELTDLVLFPLYLSIYHCVPTNQKSNPNRELVKILGLLDLLHKQSHWKPGAADERWSPVHYKCGHHFVKLSKPTIKNSSARTLSEQPVCIAVN